MIGNFIEIVEVLSWKVLFNQLAKIVSSHRKRRPTDAQHPIKFFGGNQFIRHQIQFIGANFRHTGHQLQHILVTGELQQVFDDSNTNFFLSNIDHYGSHFDGIKFSISGDVIRFDIR